MVSFAVHHPNKIHYDGAKDEEVIVQISGIGPSGTTMVDGVGQTKWGLARRGEAGR